MASRFITIGKASRLESTIDFLSKYETPENEQHVVVDVIPPERTADMSDDDFLETWTINREFTNDLHRLAAINQERKTIINKFLNHG